MHVKTVEAKVGKEKVYCNLQPGFRGPSIYTDKILKSIGRKISRQISIKDRNSKFFREMGAHPLGWVVVPLTFTTNIKFESQPNNKTKPITILAEVLIVKHNSASHNYILLGNDWFYGQNNDGDQVYLAEIVTDAKDI
jgi:hypothetical protein